MTVECKFCNYSGSSRWTLASHYRMDHEDKLGDCEFGEKTIKGN